jgi:hypothetical protein
MFHPFISHHYEYIKASGMANILHNMVVQFNLGKRAINNELVKKLSTFKISGMSLPSSEGTN